ncbi:MAG: dimethylsulfonioproprionate lyase DddP [Paracoccaceae bacterium]
MNTHYRDSRKIDPTRGATLADGSPNDDDRVEIGPTRLALAEWAAAGLTLPDLPRMRAYRHARLVDQVVARGWGGILLFDPLNIRYATDSTNMQLWNTHNPFRAVLVCADGHMVIWDYKNAPFLSSFNPLVREVRSGAGLFYFVTGDKQQPAADGFAAQVRDLLAEHAPGEARLGVDKIMIEGLRALEAEGLTIDPAEVATELARAIKGPDEIAAMRCAMHACETAVAAMYDATTPGMSEDDIWAVLHAENIRRGGEWIETRLLATGPRTNPWFQECGQRLLREDEIVAFDTDLIGPYGMCSDISRTWWIGGGAPRPDMIAAHAHAVEHIEANMAMIRPGLNIEDWVRDSHRLAPEYQAQKYSCLAHGVGLCDEWPLVAYPDEMVPGAFDHVLQPGMMLCVEALVSPEGGDFSIKLEDQVLVTEDGFENLTAAPFCPALSGG